MNYRSRKFLDLAYLYPCMLRLPCCEGGNGEPAHANQAAWGKGGSMKAHDCFVVPACRACHRELDQGKTMDRDTKFSEWNRAFGRWLPMLFNDGHLEVK